MKHLAYILPMAAAFAFAACDNIEDDERWGEKHPIVAKKNVLIEDFTGQNCSNCPLAANVIHEIQMNESIGQHVIAVSIHGGSMSYSINNHPMGLATEVGDEYNRHWNVATWPNGMVDRVGGLQEYTQWATSVAQRLPEEASVEIDINSDYASDDTHATAGTLDITVNLSETTPGALTNACLNVWLTESGITAMQQMPNGKGNNLNYVHDHVLRDCLTATLGDAVNTDSEGKATWQATYSIPLKYGRIIYTQPAFMDVVAFVTDGPDGEVLQVVQVPAASILN